MGVVAVSVAFHTTRLPKFYLGAVIVLSLRVRLSARPSTFVARNYRVVVDVGGDSFGNAQTRVQTTVQTFL